MQNIEHSKGYVHSKKIVAVGDIHGNIDCLERLWKNLEKHITPDNMKDYTFIFLGDYVDRCGKEKQVIDFLLKIKQKYNVICLMGNHDFAFASFLGLVEKPKSIPNFNFSSQLKGYTKGNLWSGNGEEDMHLQGRRYGSLVHYSSTSTFKSYGAEPGSREQLIKLVPDDHKDFLKNLHWVVESDDYIFVHGGFDDMSPLEPQLRILYNRDVTIARCKQLCDQNFYMLNGHDDTHKAVVSGHITVQEPIIREKRIMIDTGCPYGGPLTSIVLPERVIVTSETDTTEI